MVPITVPVGADQVIQLWPPKDHAVPISETVAMARRLGAEIVIVAGDGCARVKRC